METYSAITGGLVKMNEKTKISVGSETHSVIAVSDGTKTGTDFESQGNESDLAYMTAHLGLNVQFGSSDGPTVVAGFESPLQLTAAMFFAVGRKNAFVKEAPEEVLTFLKPFTDETGLVNIYEGEE